MTRTELALLARTAVHLRPGQVAQRVRLRAQRTALSRWPQASRRLLAGPDPASAVGWPLGFRPLDARLWPASAGLARRLGAGGIELLGTTRTVAPRAGLQQTGLPQADWDQADWDQAGAPQLWRFHLHYWDWAWALLGEPDRAGARALFAAVWRSWRRAAVAGRGDAWLPYPAALRAWSYCGLQHDLVAGSGTEGGFTADLAAHTGFLRRHVESDVGGNHLIKNLKALIGLAVFFADDRLLERSLGRLAGQLAVQVLPDGGHYERAPAYHCQVLADLIDVASLLAAAGHAPRPELAMAIRRMRSWLGCVLAPDGDVPLLNDGYPVQPALLAALQPVPPPPGALLTLPSTGLVRATAGRWQLLADVGVPCPDELPAHAHADTFGCLVYVDGAPLLVDTGTSTYAPGVQRSYERSTGAHNTVEVDGADSTEVWGAFRAARRARVRDLATVAGPGEVTIQATHDGFRGLPGRPRHRRRWSLTETGLRVDDLISGRGRHSIVVRWHFAAGSTLRPTAGGAVADTSAGRFAATVAASGPVRLTVGTAPVALGFGRVVAAPVLTAVVDAVLPVRLTTALSRSDSERLPARSMSDRRDGAARADATVRGAA